MFNFDTHPINVRVIGFGHKTEDAIAQLRNCGYKGCSAEIFNPEQFPSVSDENEMVILLVGNQSEDAVKCAKSFKESGVLTLAVCTEEIKYQYHPGALQRPFPRLSAFLS